MSIKRKEKALKTNETNNKNASTMSHTAAHSDAGLACADLAQAKLE